MDLKRLVAISFVILCIGGPWAFAQDTVTVHRAPEDGISAAEYWTPERASTARPFPWYQPGEGMQMKPEEKPLGPPGSAPGGMPSGDIDMQADVPEGGGAVYMEESFLEGEPPDAGIEFGTPDIGDNDFVNKKRTLWKKYPWRTIGKVFFDAASGGSGYCTASVISGNDIIVTAGHCVYEPGVGWHSNWAFVPAMRKGTRPYGTFGWASATVLTDWMSGGGRENDVALIALRTNEKGQRVTSLTGWLGRSWNWPITQHHFAFGYPGDIASGKFNCECSAESYANCGDSLVYAMGCNMTYGSSGGPWIRTFKKFRGGAMNYVNGVVSGWDACTGTFGESFNGPRFTDNNIVVLCNVVGCD